MRSAEENVEVVEVSVEREQGRQHSRPILRRDSSKNPHKPIWDHPKEAPARRIQAHYRPLITRGPQHQRCNRPRYLLTYITVDDVAQAAVALGKGALIAKIDIKSAYRLLPVCAYDCKWLGMRWKDQIFVDGMLPFGLRSVPKIFNAVADALEWIVGQEGIENIFHYLDDFAVVSPPDSPVCQQALDTLLRAFAHLKVPLAIEKQDGPTTHITFLGILIKQELRLPEDKLKQLLGMVSEWTQKKACSRQDLESNPPARLQSHPSWPFLHETSSSTTQGVKAQHTFKNPPQQRDQVGVAVVENVCSTPERSFPHHPRPEPKVHPHL